MFTGGKSVLACASVLLALAAQTSAHAIPSPALGVTGTPARSDVQRPSTAKPCGSIDPATTIDTSTAIPAAADGTVTMTVTDFNAGADGSRSVAVQVDASGKGTSFVAGTVSKNGNAAPTTVGSDQVTFTLPAGTKCVGGKAGNLCLVSVKTTAGFGACTVVSQGAAAAAAPAAAAPPAAAAAGTTAAAAAAAAGTKAAAAAGTAATANTGSAGAANAAKKAGKKGGKKGAKKAGAAKGAKGAKKAKAAAAGGAAPAAAAAKAPAAAAPKKAGTRAARALRLELNLD